MNISETSRLEGIAVRVREHIIRLSTDGGCFIGASLSCTDLLVYLYSKFLKVSPESVNDPARDYLLLSKGHDVPALYGLFVELGFLDASRLANHLNTSDHIYWHPNREIAGVEFHSGSLGHLPSVGAGVALDCKWKGQGNLVVVVLGDGELNEGSVWEACLVAAARKLDNLIWVVDRNNFQANVRTEELIPLEPLKQKFEAFGWNSLTVNGHDFDELEKAFSGIGFNGKPTVVLAETVRGKGLPSIEDRADRWFCNFTGEEVQSLIGELHHQSRAELQSKTLIVR